MKGFSWTTWRGIGAAALLPLMLLGLYGLAMQAYGLVRYDPAYFGPEYMQKYDTLTAVARSVEVALQTGDRALMSELEGRHAAALQGKPNTVFVMLVERTGRYATYLYQDRERYDQYRYHVEKVRGRYVVTPPDLYYYLYSGQWVDLFVPAAAAWWAIELLILLGVWFYRLSARRREEMYGG